MASLLLAFCGSPAGWAQEEPPGWEKLRAAYDYTVPAPLTVREEPREDAEYFRLHVRFTNLEGQRVTGLFLRPKAEGRYPSVLLLHGLTSDKEMMTESFGRALAAKGIASLALDADRHGERGSRSLFPLLLSPRPYVEILYSGVFDYRLALDYLPTREDVDGARIGLLGYSMGAIVGAILSGVDERVQATVLCVGGDLTRSLFRSIPEDLRDTVEFTSPANYAGHISPRPLLTINGKWDTVVPEAAALRLYEAAQEPKEILWADSGHLLPASVALQGVDWLAERLAEK